MSDEIMLELSDVCKQYAAPDGSMSDPILQNITLTVERGQSVAITGPSGSGKSTLLNLAGGLDTPTDGRVLLQGQDLATLSDKKLSGVRSRKVGFVFQLHHLLPQCTALENVLVPTLAAGIPSDDRETACTRAKDLLDRVGLAPRRDYRPAQLSGGERQRVAVVRALINRPSIVLADEPTGSLDHAGADALASLLADLTRDENTALVLVTHATDVASRMSRVMELRDGHLEPAP